ncbi:signal peptidase II, partial [Francisella tularensis subsp. holarctica]|nr:signal peptidase II [Francisella tularensis subsp. holarctica]
MNLLRPKVKYFILSILIIAPDIYTKY